MAVAQNDKDKVIKNQKFNFPKILQIKSGAQTFLFKQSLYHIFYLFSYVET